MQVNMAYFKRQQAISNSKARSDALATPEKAVTTEEVCRSREVKMPYMNSQ